MRNKKCTLQLIMESLTLCLYKSYLFLVFLKVFVNISHDCSTDKLYSNLYKNKCIQDKLQ